MEYKIGINRIQLTNDEENFPYPLKLWYDKETNKLVCKVLRIPEPEECKLSPYVMRGVNKGFYNKDNYDFNDSNSFLKYYGYRGGYLSRLIVCIEVSNRGRVLRQTCHESFSHKGRHKRKGGKFTLRPSSRVYLHPIVGQICVFNLPSPIYTFPPKGKPLIVTYRATFRYVKYGTGSLRYDDSIFYVSSLPERTGIYSNIIKTVK